ncbi:MAG: iron-containing alcohol dehydrogenase [Eubacteriales bacterium]|nr:iron-containing alcohol dehydrogenase [Eubacteriales bacterium]
MLNYIHDIPTRIFFGEGQIEQLAAILQPLGKKVLLCYGGGSIKENGLYDTVMNILNKGGFEVSELSGIEPNPRIGSVERGVKICHEKDIDVLLAVGGGSTIDCAKAVAAGVYYENDLWDMVTSEHDLLKALPLVDILTLSATGSEFDPAAVISNPETKEKLGNVYTYPTASICDPTYTFSVSAYQTAAGSADIMSHVCEEYFSRTMDSDLSEGMAETVLRSVMKNCPLAIQEPENYNARANLMACASIACSGVLSYGKESSGWPCHAMEHELSAYYDITHGVGLAILTPRWMRLILKKDPTTTPRFAKFARNVMGLTGDDESKLAFAGIDALEKYFISTGIPMNLQDLNIGTEHFEEMAVHANRGGRLDASYVPLSQEDVVAIYNDCL